MVPDLTAQPREAMHIVLVACRRLDFRAGSVSSGLRLAPHPETRRARPPMVAGAVLKLSAGGSPVKERRPG